MTSERVEKLEARLEAQEKKMKRFEEKLQAMGFTVDEALGRLSELEEEVGEVLEARECESDDAIVGGAQTSDNEIVVTDDTESISTERDGSTISDEDDGELPSEIYGATPVRLSKVIKHEYAPVSSPTKKKDPTIPLVGVPSVSSRLQPTRKLAAADTKKPAATRTTVLDAIKAARPVKQATKKRKAK